MEHLVMVGLVQVSPSRMLFKYRQYYVDLIVKVYEQILSMMIIYCLLLVPTVACQAQLSLRSREVSSYNHHSQSPYSIYSSATFGF
jgi:hypothetical protein